MAKRSRRRRKQAVNLPPHVIPGTAPGTLVADPSAPQPEITVFAYDDKNIEEETITDPDKLKSFLNKRSVVWVNIEGLGNVDSIRVIGETFGIHQLALEDVVSCHQRAKTEMYGENYFLISHMIELKEELITEQVSLFVGHGFVVTFQEGPLDCFETVRDRIRKDLGRIRKAGPDYLAYRLLDAVVDCYFPVLEQYGERLENLEDEILEKADRVTIGKVHDVKRELLVLRRAIWPLREAIGSLMRDSSGIFTNETLVYLRDCHDHAVQICDFIETSRELCSDLMDFYLSSASNRLGEGMKLLTIITTICAPPTVVAGIYGMNFNTEVSPFNMPELNWFLGYPFALCVMVFLCIVTGVVLQSQGWLNFTNVTKPGGNSGTSTK